MLKWRLISAAILLSGLLTLLWMDFHGVVFGRPGAWLLPVALIASALATGEMLSLLGHQNHRLVNWTVYVGTLLIVLCAGAPIFWKTYPLDCPLGKLGWPLLGMGAGICLAFIGEMRRYTEPGGVIVRVALSIFVMAYVGLLMAFLVELRLFHDNAWGMAALVSMILVTKMADTGAYFTGRAIGRHKMTPYLSPKKTIEGGVGGCVASVGASWLFFAVLLPRWFVADAAPTAWWRWLVYGLSLAIVGTVGDLAESLLKRDMDRKDSSTWLKGLGGVLDIVDSLLFAAPVAFFLWAAGVVGPAAK